MTDRPLNLFELPLEMCYCVPNASGACAPCRERKAAQVAIDNLPPLYCVDPVKGTVAVVSGATADFIVMDDIKIEDILVPGGIVRVPLRELYEQKWKDSDHVNDWHIKPLPSTNPHAKLHERLKAHQVEINRQIASAFRKPNPKLIPTPIEGGTCPHFDCPGTLNFERQGDCSCHISPPCSNCVTQPLVCNSCRDHFKAT
jgi:hypothetical protein